MRNTPPKGWLKAQNNGMFTIYQLVRDFFHHPQYFLLEKPVLPGEHHYPEHLLKQ
jgi:hypothetical protein